MTLNFKLDHLIQAMFSSLLVGESGRLNVYRALVEDSTITQQKNILFSVLRIFSRRLSPAGAEPVDEDEIHARKKTSAGTVAILREVFLEDGKQGSEILAQWITGNAEVGVGQDIVVHRAVIAALAQDQRRFLHNISTVQLLIDG